MEYYYNNWKHSTEYLEKRKQKRLFKETSKITEITEQNIRQNEALKSASIGFKPVNKKTNESEGRFHDKSSSGPIVTTSTTVPFDPSRSVKTFICDSCKRSKLNFSSIKSPTYEYDHCEYTNGFSKSTNGQNQAEHFKFVIKKDSLSNNYVKVDSESDSETNKPTIAASSAASNRLSLLDDPHLKENLNSKYSIFSSSSSSPHKTQQQQEQKLQLYQYKRHVGDSQTSNLCNDCWIYWKKYAIFKYSTTDLSKFSWLFCEILRKWPN